VHTEVSVARQSSKRPDADEPETELDETSRPDPEAADADLEADADLDGVADPESGATPDEPADRTLWEEVRIDPVEIALPAGTGFTLRAYRLSTELTLTDIGDRDQDDPFSARAGNGRAGEEEEIIILDDRFAEDDEAEAVEEATPRRGRKARKDATDADEDAEELEAADLDAEEAEDAAESDDPADAEDIEDEEPAAEEVPAFLTHRGKLLLFKSPESLISFVRSGAPHDLAQLDTWDEFVTRVQPADIVPLDEDSYELDLVVENLRGGHDAWDPTLLIEAGEAARDIAYALQLTSLLDMLSSGSSLDDLDEALRATVNGGIGGFMGRRRLKKIGAQTASLGWRTIVGKISAAVDWRD
jgi:hypothetical protein